MALSKTMKYKVDWLAFTLPVQIGANALHEMRRIMDYLTYDLNDFKEIAGRYSYNSGLTLGNYVNIFYNNPSKKLNENPQASINIIWTGQGCTDLNDKLVRVYGSSDYEQIWINFFDFLQSINVKITRLDLALDDFGGAVDFNVLVNKLNRGEYRSIKKTYNVLRSADQQGRLQGLTIYIGSNVKTSKGCYYLRMYDKYAQYFAKSQIPPKEARKTGVWQRYELSFSKSKARKFVEKIQVTGSFGKAYFGVMRTTIEFLIPRKTQSGKKYSDKNKWKVCIWWQRFLNDMEKVKLSDAERDVDIAGLLHWLRIEVVPSLRLLEQVGLERGFDIYQLIRQCDINSFSKKQERMLNNALDLPDKLLNLYLTQFKDGYK